MAMLKKSRANYGGAQPQAHCVIAALAVRTHLPHEASAGTASITVFPRNVRCSPGVGESMGKLLRKPREIKRATYVRSERVTSRTIVPGPADPRHGPGPDWLRDTLGLAPI